MSDSGGTLLNSKIFVVEDDENINTLVSKALSSQGYRIKSFYTGRGLVEEITKSPPQLIILDLILPDMDGIEIMREVKKIKDIPVIMVTSKKAEIDRVVGLELGADDYIVKPFSLRELVARVKTVLRRYSHIQAPREDKIILGEFIFDLTTKEATIKGESLKLTKTEVYLLEEFLKKQGALLTKDNLITNVWGYNTDIQTRTLDVHLGNLRRKLDRYHDIPFSIQTVHSIGYKLLVKK